MRQGIASPGFEIGSSHHEIAIFPALPIAYSHVPLWTRIHQPVLLFDPEKGKGPRPSEGSGTVPKVCSKYRRLSKSIKIHRNPGGQKNARSTGEIPYFMRLLFFLCLLHTVEVRGSNPLSPILSETPAEISSPSIAQGRIRRINNLRINS